MKKALSILIYVFLAIAVTTCGDDPVTPPELQPGRRDYVWEVDTLHIDNEVLDIYGMWGSSPNDIWAAGNATSMRYNLWHYNGNQWSTDAVSRIIRGSLHGFSRNDIWMVGERAMWHYNGIEWSKYQELTIETDHQLALNNVWGRNNNDIYVVGFAQKVDNSEQIGVIFNYNGSEWNQVNIPKTHGVFGIGYEDNNSWLYVEGIARDSTTGTLYANALWGYDGNQIKEIHITNSSSIALSEMNDQIYATIDNKIYKLNNGDMKLWKDFSNEKYFGMVEGRNEKDFFGGDFTGIKHYNGTDLQVIYPTNDFVYDVDVLENEVFALARTYDYKMLVIHGILE